MAAGTRSACSVSKLADKIGCSINSGKDCLGLTSPTSADVKVAGHADNKYTIDLSDGNDSFDKGDCATQVDVYGGAGVDTLLAGTNTTIAGDHFHGGSGIDTLSYASRNKGVIAAADGVTASGDPAGSGEQDIIESDIENIIGGSGDDTLVAGLDATSTHCLTGGDGNDILISSPGGKTTFEGGLGIDTVDYSGRSHGVTITIGDGKANDGESADLDNVGLDVENAIGTDYADVITGSSLANTITPGLGNDTVNGGDGDDTFLASANSDDGNDTYNGGKGTDTVNYSLRSGGVCVVLDGVSHSGACTFTMGEPIMNISPTDTDTVGLDVENAVGTASDDHLVGNSSSNLLTGLGGADWIEGKAGDDQLDANAYTSSGGKTCNPVTRACIGTFTGTCDCASATLTANCSPSSLLDCGNDPLDLAACAGGGTSQFVGCWKTQY